MFHCTLKLIHWNQGIWQNSPLLISSAKTFYNSHSESFVTCWHLVLKKIHSTASSVNSQKKGPQIWLMYSTKVTVIIKMLGQLFLLYNGMMFVSNPVLWFYVVRIQASVSHRKKLRVMDTVMNTSQTSIRKLILSIGSAGGWKWWVHQWYSVCTKLGFLWLWKWMLLVTPREWLSGLTSSQEFLVSGDTLVCVSSHQQQTQFHVTSWVTSVYGTGVQPLSEVNCTVIVRMAV